MIITEFTLDHPILREPLTATPGVEVTGEQTFEQSDGPLQMLVWVTADDFETFDDAVERDEGVENPVLVATPGDRRLYRFDFTEYGRVTNLYPVVVDAGGVPQAVVGTEDGWWFRVQFPDREAFEGVYHFCRDHDVGFTFHQIFEQADWTDERGITLTDAQRETLVQSVDAGYLAIPRECSLEELGAHMDVSESAASERFRRAVRNLVEQTVYR